MRFAAIYIEEGSPPGVCMTRVVEDSGARVRPDARFGSVDEAVEDLLRLYPTLEHMTDAEVHHHRADADLGVLFTDVEHEAIIFLKESAS